MVSQVMCTVTIYVGLTRNEGSILVYLQRRCSAVDRRHNVGRNGHGSPALRSSPFQSTSIRRRLNTAERGVRVSAGYCCELQLS